MKYEQQTPFMRAVFRVVASLAMGEALDDVGQLLDVYRRQGTDAQYRARILERINFLEGVIG